MSRLRARPHLVVLVTRQLVAGLAMALAHLPGCVAISPPLDPPSLATLLVMERFLLACFPALHLRDGHLAEEIVHVLSGMESPSPGDAQILPWQACHSWVRRISERLEAEKV